MESADLGERADYILAYIDVLGSRQRQNDAAQAARDMISLHSRLLSCLSQVDHENTFKFVGFSDSIFIYHKVVPLEDRYPSLELRFLRMLCKIQNVSWNLGLPLRGGVAIGELYTALTPYLTVITGIPVREAYLHETKQNWVGVSMVPKSCLEQRLDTVYDNIIRYAEDEKIIHNYRIPISQERRIESHWVLSWENRNLDSIRNQIMREQQTLAQQGNQRDSEKYAVTKDYIEWLIDEGGALEDETST